MAIKILMTKKKTTPGKATSKDAKASTAKERALPPPNAAAAKPITDEELFLPPLEDIEGVPTVHIKEGKKPQPGHEAAPPPPPPQTSYQPTASDIQKIIAPSLGAATPAAQPSKSWVGWLLLLIAFGIIGFGFWYFLLRKPKVKLPTPAVATKPVVEAPPPPAPNFDFKLPGKGDV